MKLLAVGRPTGDGDARNQIVHHAQDEMAALWRLYRDGIVREMYSPGGPGAVLMLEASSREDGVAALARLPLVAHGLIEFEVTECRPFSAFEILFREPGSA